MHERFMREALREAALSGNDVPVGAVIVRDGQIIARAHNECEQKGDPLMHAEMLAMARACRESGESRLTNCTMYVTLEPCPMCAGGMLMARLGMCVFGAYDDKQGCCGSVYDLPHDPAFYHHTKCMGGVLEKECAQLLQSFFSAKRG